MIDDKKKRFKGKHYLLVVKVFHISLSTGLLLYKQKER